ncbi:MAG: hypothetical protein FPO08_11885 [Geobacter sp.]|nr:MAG: hypothetical protein FPO08_11885 [Geobacter sp.]
MPYDDTNDPDLITLSEAVLQAYTPEMYNHMISLMPTPEIYAATHGQFANGYPAYLKGDPDGIKAFEEARNAIKQFLTMLSGLSKTAAIKDPTVPQRLPLPQTHARTTGSNTALDASRDLSAYFDSKGNIYATFSKIPNAKGYQIWLCVGDPNVAGNWRLLASSTNSRKVLLPALNRTQNNWLKIRGMRGTEAGPWSNLVSVEPM